MVTPRLGELTIYDLPVRNVSFDYWTDPKRPREILTYMWPASAAQPTTAAPRPDAGKRTITAWLEEHSTAVYIGVAAAVAIALFGGRRR